MRPYRTPQAVFQGAYVQAVLEMYDEAVDNMSRTFAVDPLQRDYIERRAYAVSFMPDSAQMLLDNVRGFLEFSRYATGLFRERKHSMHSTRRTSSRVYEKLGHKGDVDIYKRHLETRAARGYPFYLSDVVGTRYAPLFGMILARFHEQWGWTREIKPGERRYHYKIQDRTSHKTRRVK